MAIVSSRYTQIWRTMMGREAAVFEILALVKKLFFSFHMRSSKLSTLFDDPSPLYDNNHYHEECLRCNSCGLNLTGPNQKRARRFKNQILCDLHFADVALMECSDFMQQLRSFKPQSLGCAVARRKSSTTLIFPLPPQACSAGQGNFGRKNRPRTEEGGTVFGSLAKPIEPSVYAIPV
ncbi:hypothetical protein V9T40_005591 [Parthenolecanium corni]|uniref:LIM zinc-binding domain-containing protein n=1 Tax=Parthenolecanium corni TaxID=536013 RepID=A0AAN9TWY5_9HEMI